jgi:hypothetical protein
MIDYEKLTDTEIAMLMFAIESFYDEAKDPSMFTEESEQVTGEFYADLEIEYHRRNLHYSRWQIDG